MKARKRKALNVSVSNDLIIESKRYDINFSQVLEERLIEILKERRAQKWRDENKEAIATYNERIAKQGEFSRKLRRF